MSSFSVETHALVVEDHPCADRLDIARVGDTGFKAVVAKGRFKTGDQAVFVPDAAVVPAELLKAAGYWNEERDKGFLAGNDGCRVKATKLRKILSDGILLSLTSCAMYAERDARYFTWEAYDYSETLGIVKYAPPVAQSMSGKTIACSTIRSYTDIENSKKFPEVVQWLADERLDVAVTEKIHGSCCIVHLDPGGALYVSSKGLAKRGLALVDTPGNVYWRAVRENGLEEAVRAIREKWGVSASESITLYGEVYGPKIQGGFGYDTSPDATVRFRAFDIRLGDTFMSFLGFLSALEGTEVERVPVLAAGTFSEDLVYGVRDGRSTLNKGTQREGVVVRPMVEQKHDSVGRVCLKFVSPAYLDKSTGEETS